MALSVRTTIVSSEPSDVDAGSDLRTSDPTREYLGGSTTRKFQSSEESTQQSIDVVDEKMTFNSDVLVEAAAGLSTIAMMAPSIAEISRERLAVFREAIATATEESFEPPIDAMAARSSITSDMITMTSKSMLEQLPIDLARDLSIRPIEPLLSQVKEPITTRSVTNVDATLSMKKNEFDAATTERIGAAASEMINLGVATSAFKNKREVGFVKNDAVPILEQIALDESKKRGSIDKFFVGISFVVKTDLIKKNNLKGFRVFRSTIVDPKMMRRSKTRMSLTAMDAINSEGQGRSKTENVMIAQSTKLDLAGIENVLSTNVKRDDITNVWHGSSAVDMSSSIDSRTAVVSETSKMLVSEFISDEKYHSMDQSVAQDLNTLRNIQLQDPKAIATVDLVETQGSSVINRASVDMLSNSQIIDSRKKLGKEDTLVRTKKNSSNFVEIAFMPIDMIDRHDSFGLSNFYISDSTVEYGRSYRYFVVSVDERMVESARSKMASIKIEVVRVPEPPESVILTSTKSLVALSILHRSSDIEKFEIYRKSSKPLNNPKREIQVVNGKRGFVIDTDVREILKSGYSQIGEVLNSSQGTNSFIDRDVIDGITYFYRVYSVDVYGNKSSMPNESSINVGDSLDLIPPNLIVEQDSESHYMKITMSSDDDRIVAFFLSRRDVTIGQDSFIVPNQPQIMKTGAWNNCLSRHRSMGSFIDDQDSWTGYHENDGKNVVFIDKVTEIDHSYQYMLYGVGRNGANSSCAFSKPTIITRRKFIKRPINLKHTVSASGSIMIEWDNANNVFSPHELIGDRDELEKSSIRTLYQVERKKIDEGEWKFFPLIDKQRIDETIGTGTKRPTGYPEELVVDTKYLYRVKAYQTGGYSSNYSDQLIVSTMRQMLPPVNFIVTYQDVNVRPFFVSLNWDTPTGSLYVDGWEIYRAEINNFAADSLSFSDVNVLDGLKFDHLTDVYTESSRFRSRDADELDRTEGRSTTIGDVLIGSHHYVDQSVSFGNTYVYKIRTFGTPDHSFSTYVYKGIRLTSQMFEQKLGMILTDEEKDFLRKETIPLVLRRDLVV